jgi:3-hydroxy-9,10-secoandrosta-1,3,5(10)-triene-9,17-dione monooxygenase reductase component
MRNAEEPFDVRGFRRALSSFATGVTVVASRDTEGDVLVGVTVNSFASVSLDPPLVLWSVLKRNPNLPRFVRAKHFSINVLANDQRELCRHFAEPRSHRFETVEHALGLGGAPVLPESCAVFECENHAQVDGGDHVIFIGRVRRFSSNAKDPLVLHGGAQKALGEPLPDWERATGHATSIER